MGGITLCCVVPGSTVYLLLAVVLQIFVWGCLGEPIWLVGSPGKEHCAILVVNIKKNNIQ